MESLQVRYHLAAAPNDAATRARAVLLEQSIETPVAVAERHAFVREHMMGEVVSLEPAPEGGYHVTLALPAVTAGVDPAQLLNVLFGNVSLHADVQLLGFTLPAALRDAFAGPRFGIEGFRSLTGARGRPLTCSALKPVGLGLDDLEALCRAFAEGGIDVIKDDHYLADHPFSPFEARVQRCQRAVDAVAERTGHRTLYVPNLSGTPDQVRRQAEVAQATGARAVMVAPMLLGLPFLHELTQQHLDVPVLAHPSFGGSLRIAPATLLGKLFRLYGADAVIFPSFGGRFAYAADTCREVVDALRAPWDQLHPALPVPAGGMKVERAAELVAFYGPDVMLLVGGSLLLAGDALADRTRTFTEAVAAAAREPLNPQGITRP